MKIFYLEINLIGVAVLLIVFFSLIARQGKNLVMSQKLFSVLLFANVAVLLFDTLMYVLRGTQGYANYVALVIFSFLYYYSQIIVCLMWFIYSYYKVTEDKDRLEKLLPIILIPAIIALVMCIVNLFNGFLYNIIDNKYVRSELFWLPSLICLIYLGASFIMILRESNVRKNEKGRDFFFLLTLVPTIPIICSILQALFYGLSLIWIGTALSFLLIYLNIQNNQIYTDDLTGMYNRRHLFNYLAASINSSSRSSLYLILCDINSFKKINDTFGHLAGDKALVDVSRLLDGVCKHQKEKVSRFGGDEFIIIGKTKNGFDAIKSIENITTALDKYNENDNNKIKIGMSFGHANYTEGMTLDEFIERADDMMYENKGKRPCDKFEEKK